MFGACSNAQEPSEAIDSLALSFNYEPLINTKGDAERKILENWKNYLASGKRGYYYEESLQYWFTTDDFPWPNNFMTGIARNSEEMASLQTTVMGIYPIRRDTYALKTMFCYFDKVSQKVIINDFYTVYAIPFKDDYKFLSAPQWYSFHWSNRKIGTISYFFPPQYFFSEKKALELNQFNQEIAKIFKMSPIYFKYFICSSVEDAYKTVGYDYNLAQFVKTQTGAVAYPSNKAIFSGNNSELYPHEVVHLYTNQYRSQNKISFHTWFDEGIATLFGGSRGYSLDWHLSKLKNHLKNSKETSLENLNQLITVPNGEHMTEYRNTIGGLLCKLIYEKHGMDGLFDVLKSGHTDEDFFNTVERYFGVKKDGFTAFIRRELQKLPEPKN
jgi:hypothetical protein